MKNNRLSKTPEKHKPSKSPITKTTTMTFEMNNA